MNILITIYRSLGYGGAEVSTNLLARELQKLGHKIVIASTQKYLEIKTEIFKEFHKVPFYFFHEYYLSDFLRRLIRKYSIDIVYPQDRLTTIPAIIAAKKESKKVVVHFRDFWYACPMSSCLTPKLRNYDVCNYKIILNEFPKNRLLWNLYKWHYIKNSWKLLESADAKIVSSNIEKEKLLLCHIKTNINVIPIARDVGTFKNVNGEELKRKFSFKKYIVTFVGSLFYTKGVSILLKIIPIVLERNKNITFLIVGNGDMEVDVRRMINKNKIEDNVVLTGRLAIEDVAKAYAISDIVLLPSIWNEPFSGVPLEVGAAGKSLIASDIGAIKEMDGDFKILVKPFDYDGWIDSILRLIRDRNLREALGENGKKMVKNYSIVKISKKINSLFQSCT